MVKNNVLISVYSIIVNDETRTGTIALQGVCELFHSFLWDIEYYMPGQFEIHVPASHEMVRIMKVGNIVRKNDDTKNAGIIERVRLECDVENGDFLTVSGRFLISLFDRRIVHPLVWVNQTYCQLVQYVSYYTCMNGAEDKDRIFPNLSRGDMRNYGAWGERITTTTEYQNLMEFVFNICKVVRGTAYIAMNLIDNTGYTMRLEVDEGVDRSTGQTERPPVIFSDQYNNLLKFEVNHSEENIKNFGYVEDPTLHRNDYNLVWYYNRFFGRREFYIDAKNIDLSKLDDKQAKLREMAIEEGDIYPTRLYEFTISANDLQFAYRRDYNVGDYVTAEYAKYGISGMKAQVIGMIESYDQNGYNLTPTLQIIER